MMQHFYWEDTSSSASQEILSPRRCLVPECSSPCSQHQVTALSHYNAVHIPLRSILISPKILSALFPQSFPTNFVKSPNALSFCFKHPNDIWRRKLTKLIIMKFSPTPCYLFYPWSKYSPQHFVVKHFQFTWDVRFSWRQAWSLTDVTLYGVTSQKTAIVSLRWTTNSNR
jgi:hypothetical protein